MLLLAGCHVSAAVSEPSPAGAAAISRVEVDAPAPVRGGTKLEGITAMSVGLGHACALRENGSVWCWGGNATGALGRDDVERSMVARPVAGLPPAVQLAAGDGRTCVIDGDEDVWCLGSNFYGQADADRGRTSVPSWVSLAFCGGGTGDRDTDNLRFSPQRVSGVRGATALALGMHHTCAATAEGVVCWGSAEYGAIGEQADASFQRVLTPLPGPVRAVVAGTTHTCAIDGEGRTWCWGDEQIDDSGVQPPHRVTGLPEGRDLAILGYQTCLLAHDDGGTTWCWGGDPPDEYTDLADPWERYRPEPEAVALPVPWSRFVHVNGFPCTIGDEGGVECVDTMLESTVVRVEGIEAPVIALDGEIVVCSLSQAGTVHCFSAYDESVMVSDWAGTGGRAMPVMVELDLDAPPQLPEGALVRPAALPPVEARTCESSVGRCTHRLGQIVCRCDGGARSERTDPAGLAWYDDADCFVELAAACGPGRSESVGVECKGQKGRCGVRGGPDGMVSCGCADGNGVATGGEDDWTGRSDAELVEICRAQIDEQCG